MTRKLVLTSIVMVGVLMALGSNAWAGRDRHHHHGKGYHKHHKAHHGHHHGWKKDQKHHKRCYRHHRICRYHDDRRGHQHGWGKAQRYHKRCYRNHRAHRHDGYRRPVVVEKHVYHHYESQAPLEANDGFRFAFSVADEVIGVSVAVSELY